LIWKQRNDTTTRNQMKKHCVLLFLLFAIATITRAQDAPPPAYLLKQDFPDSVKNLSMLKLDGSHVDFASVLKLHQGKKVIIDFWASWCRDCIIGLPKLEKLKQKTGDKVVYIFISVDEDDTKWRSAINRFDIRGEHYRIEKGWYNALSNYVELDWVPRYIVLNEQGKIIMPKAIVANNEALEKSLMK